MKGDTMISSSSLRACLKIGILPNGKPRYAYGKYCGPSWTTARPARLLACSCCCGGADEFMEITRSSMESLVPRRLMLGSTLATPLLFQADAVQAHGVGVDVDNRASTVSPAPWPQNGGLPDYSQPGPFRTSRVERQKHTCSSCFQLCLANECMLRINVTYPRNFLEGDAQHRPTFPLAIFSSGFLIDSKQYVSYADRLASWGYVVLTYDKVENMASNRNDVVTACFIRELIDWASTSAALEPITDTSRVYLCGHSRGGKVSVLAAASDPRVVSVCLIDPVDNTVYAPLGPGYPSALRSLASSAEQSKGGPSEQRFIRGGDARDSNASLVGVGGDTPEIHQMSAESQLAEALEVKWRGSPIPLAVVGAAKGGDCAPVESNYKRFFNAAPAPKWALEVEDAGHFQFVDSPSSIQRGVCTEGKSSYSDVQNVALGVLVAWAELTVRRVCRSMCDDEISTAHLTSIGERVTLGSTLDEVDVMSEKELAMVHQILQHTSESVNREFGTRTRINSQIELV